MEMTLLEERSLVECEEQLTTYIPSPATNQPGEYFYKLFAGLENVSVRLSLWSVVVVVETEINCSGGGK